MINFSNVIYSFLCVFFTLFVLLFLFSPEYNTSGHAPRPPEALVEGGVEFENTKDTIFYFRYTKKSKKMVGIFLEALALGLIVPSPK